MRILLVEDNPTDALLVEVALEDSGVGLTAFAHAETLAEGEAQIRETIFDVIVVDLNVPDGQGLGNFERMQKAAPMVPVIVLTGLSDEKTALEAIQRGAADYLIKGQAESAILERSIRYAIERKRNEKQRLALERAEIKRAEAEAANRAKDEFLAMLSHELRTPLNAILGWTSLLQTESLDKETTIQALDIVERNARVQAQLIEDLLDVSRIVAGNFKIESVNLDFNSIVRSARETLGPSIDAKKQTVILDLQPLPRLCGDAMRLQQVVWNLITNAVKFTPEGGEITLETRFKNSQGNATAILNVRDNGQGIAAEFLPHIFDRFRQADGSSTRRQGGLGLGLAIAKNVVELHGGQISVHSDGRNQGTRFQVELPLDSDDCDPLETPENAPRERFNWSKMRVLIAADGDATGEFARLTLAQRGAQIRSAHTLSDAQMLLENWRPHCLICVLGLKKFDTFPLVESSKDHEILAVALAHHTPADNGERQRALAAGFSEFLTNPLSPQPFCEALETVFQRAPQS